MEAGLIISDPSTSTVCYLNLDFCCKNPFTMSIDKKYASDVMKD